MRYSAGEVDIDDGIEPQAVENGRVAANILSRFVHGELARVSVPVPMYRHPVVRGRPQSAGKRSPADTRQVARFGENCESEEACGLQEAARL